MIKNITTVAISSTIFFTIIAGGIYIKNLQENNFTYNKYINENSKTNTGIEKLLTDSIKLEKWNDFDTIQCIQGDSLEQEQMLKEAKDKIQKINKSELKILRTDDIILLKETQILTNLSESLMQFKILNINDEKKCIQIIL